MKVSEITQQTNEAWLDTAKKFIATNTGRKEDAYVLGATGSLLDGFHQGLRIAGVKIPSEQTSEDLAEYLFSAGVGPDVVKQAFQQEFPKGFAPAPKDDETGGDGTGGDDTEQQPNVPGQPSVQDLPDDEEEQQPNVPGQPVANDPNNPLTWDEKQLDPEDPADREKGKKLGINYGKNQTGWYVRSTPNKGNAGNLKQNQKKPQPDQVIDRSGDKETFVQKLKRKMKNKFGKQSVKPDSKSQAVRLPQGLNPQTGQYNSLDFSGKSLIAEQEKVMTTKEVRNVIHKAMQLQSRVSTLDNITVPGNAQRPSVSAKTLFTAIDKELASGATGDSTVDTIAAQITNMTDDQRSALTAILTAKPQENPADDSGE